MLIKISEELMEKHRIIMHLFTIGANIEAKDEMGWTPLHCASFTNKNDIVKYLVSKVANQNVKTKYGASSDSMVFG